jgi:hypothetical protein
MLVLLLLLFSYLYFGLFEELNFRLFVLSFFGLSCYHYSVIS